MAVGYNPRIVTDGLVLALDAGNTKSYPGSGTTWSDLSGNGNNGTLTNMDGANLNSANGGSLTFDGTNEYVECGSGIDSNISFGQGKSFTIEILFETDNYSPNQSIIARRNTDGSGETDYMLFYSADDLIFGTGQAGVAGDSGSWMNLQDAFNFNNQIMHFCGVVSSTGAETGTKTVYKDGVQVDSKSYTKKASSTANSTFIGKYLGDGYYLDGKIYAVRIYNKALTASEVKQNFNALRGRFGI